MFKRGQITTFIIIGIVILFSVAAALLLRNIVVEQRATTILSPITESVPLELNPVRIFTEDCIRSTGIDGLNLLGQQGGWINPDLAGHFDNNSPTESDGLEFSSLKIPYWYYNSKTNGANTVILESNAPGLKRAEGPNSIEIQLDKYINEELGECLQEYKPFTDQGFEIDTGDIDTTTTIVPGHVVFLVDFPVRMSKGGSKKTLKRHYVDIPLDLHGLYDVAYNITAAQEEYSFLEQQTLSMLAIYSAIDQEKLPPMTGSSFELGKMVIWFTDDVENDMEELLMTSIPSIRYYGSSNFYRYEFPASDPLQALSQQVYDNMILDLNKPTPYQVNFNYIGWPIYLNLNGGSEIIMPQSSVVNFLMVNFGMQRYKTTYDISWPVMVSLHDPEAFDRQGYTFNFALEGNVINNNYVANEQTILPSSGDFKETMLCDIDKRDSGNITVNVVDSYDQTSLSDASIFYSIMDDSCYIDITASSVTTQFPIGYGGLITAIKQDYLSNSIPVDIPDEDYTDSFTIKLNKIKPINISVKKKRYLKCIGRSGTKLECPPLQLPLGLNPGWNFISAPVPLEPDEQAVITFNRISDYEPDFTTAATVTGTEQQQILLAPGEYEVSITKVLNREVVIPPDKRCSGGGLFSSEECVTIPEVSFEALPNGGITWNTPENYWKLTAANLGSSNKITFYTISIEYQELPRSPRYLVIEDLDQLNNIEQYSIENRVQLNPTYS